MAALNTFCNEVMSPELPEGHCGHGGISDPRPHRQDTREMWRKLCLTALGEFNHDVALPP